MSAKRPSLAESMRAVAVEPPAAVTPMPSAPSPKLQTQARVLTPPERPEGFYAATRAGKKKATATMSAEAHRQLKILAVEQGGIEKLLTEAINDLFCKYGKEPIA